MKNRILCLETTEKIVECGYGDFYNTLTEKEAIEKMAKAIFDYNHNYKYNWDNVEKEHKKIFINFAKQALEAILRPVGSTKENAI